MQEKAQCVCIEQKSFDSSQKINLHLLEGVYLDFIRHFISLVRIVSFFAFCMIKKQQKI